MTAPERIWTASTNGKCHVGFDTPSLNYTNEYIRADLAALEPPPDPRDEVIARLVEALADSAAVLSGAEMSKSTLIRALEKSRAALAAAKAVQHG